MSKPVRRPDQHFVLPAAWTFLMKSQTSGAIMLCSWSMAPDW